MIDHNITMSGSPLSVKIGLRESHNFPTLSLRIFSKRTGWTPYVTTQQRATRPKPGRRVLTQLIERSAALLLCLIHNSSVLFRPSSRFSHYDLRERQRVPRSVRMVVNRNRKFTNRDKKIRLSRPEQISA